MSRGMCCALKKKENQFWIQIRGPTVGWGVSILTAQKDLAMPAIRGMPLRPNFPDLLRTVANVTWVLTILKLRFIMNPSMGLLSLQTVTAWHLIKKANGFSEKITQQPQRVQLATLAVI